MPRSCPHPLALFSLVPVEKNVRAEAVVAHSENNHNVSTLSDGLLALDVGFHIRGKSSETLATLGRNVDADIYIEGSAIARVQCSFEINLNTGVVMLYDRSFAGSTQVFGMNSMPFERERDERKVLVQKGLNTIIGMGGEKRNLVEFELRWHQNFKLTAEIIKNCDTLPCGRFGNPRLARTTYELPTDLPSQRETRIHTSRQRQLKMRYIKAIEDRLGSGQFGEVYKAIDVDSGKFMAVKILKQPTKMSKKQERNYVLKREIETLSSMEHPHIIDYIASQGWEESQVEIFMGLKDGDLDSLVESGVDALVIAESVFPQMLQALDYLAWKGIVHRDTKPENILYTLTPNGKYQYQLGDFGLCNRAINARTNTGSPLYMAPEMFQQEQQTHKVDVWSLFVTILWILDAEDFRQASIQFVSYAEVRRAVLSAASNVDLVFEIREMAIVDPERRASAAQMLVKHFNGLGLSTPRDRVPAFEITIDKGPSTASLTTQTTQTKPRGLK